MTPDDADRLDSHLRQGELRLLNNRTLEYHCLLFEDGGSAWRLCLFGCHVAFAAVSNCQRDTAEKSVAQ